MCLVRLERPRPKPKKPITVYKRIGRCRGVAYSVCFSYYWHKGWNDSGRASTSDERDSYSYSSYNNRGFHVYTSLHAAERSCFDGEIVKFSAKPEHFVVWGKPSQALFTKLYLTKAEAKKLGIK